MNSPIVVTGPPRSGTTWMQWCLSQHPEIHIHGQFPNLSWHAMHEWLGKMSRQGKWAERSNNNVGYEIKHYCGSPPNRCKEIFKRMFKDYICGYGEKKPQWGGKFLWFTANKKWVTQIEELWKDVKWITCIRDPFKSFESQKNTFVSSQSLEEWIEKWIVSVNFAHERDCPLFQIDKLETTEQRVSKIKSILTYIGESPHDQIIDFVTNFNVVHKIKQDKDRKFTLGEKRREEMINEYPALPNLMNKLGYGA